MIDLRKAPRSLTISPIKSTTTTALYPVAGIRHIRLRQQMMKCFGGDSVKMAGTDDDPLNEFLDFGPYEFFLRHVAQRDLEHALRHAPNNFC